jgi:phosphonate transport system substrate-binding protein
MLKRVLILGLISLFSAGITGCSEKRKAERIRLAEKEVASPEAEPSEVRSLRIAVGSMITPRAGFGYYKQLLDYIGEKVQRPVRFVDRENYAEINKLIESGEIDAAFVCGKPYVDGRDKFGLELLVAPQAYGQTVYHSYIIVSRDSPIESLEGLRGRTFAFMDPMSNTGRLVPAYMLAKMGETPDSFFEKYVYTYAHDKSIKAVAQGIVDGAAVDHLIWEYADRTNPEFTSKTKVIEKSPPYGIPPVVVPPGLDPRLKERLRQILLNVHKDEKGKEILKGMMIDKFVIVDDSTYDSVREMNRRIADKNSE